MGNYQLPQTININIIAHFQVANLKKVIMAISFDYLHLTLYIYIY